MHSFLTILLAAVALGASGEPVRVLSIAFEGNASLDAGRLKAQLQVTRQGGWYRPDVLAADLPRLEQYYRDEGFLKASIGQPTVEMRDVAGKGAMAAIRIPVVEGPRFTLGEIAVRNVQVLRSATLLQMAPIRPGDPYNRTRIMEWRERIAEAYRSMGHLRFSSDLKEEIREVRRVVDCTLECTEGSAYYVGKISVVGDPSIDSLDFKRRLMVSEGGLYNPEMLSLSIAFVNQMRTYRPITMSDVEINVDDAKHTVNLVFRVSLRSSSSSDE